MTDLAKIIIAGIVGYTAINITKEVTNTMIVVKERERGSIQNHRDGDGESFE